MELCPPHPLRSFAAHCGAAAAAPRMRGGLPPPAPSARLCATARAAEILGGAGETFPRSLDLAQFAEFCARNLIKSLSVNN